MQKSGVVLLIALCAFGTQRVQAQDEGSTSRGLSVGGDLLARVMRTTLANGAMETPTGVGLRGVLSYGLTSDWSVFGAVETVSIRTGSSDRLRLGELGTRFTFLGDPSPARPYLEAAISTRQIRTQLPGPNGTSIGINSVGLAPVIAGGVQLFIVPSVAFDLGLSISTGRFRDPRIDGKRVPVVTGTSPSTELRLGARYFFSRDRDLY